MKWEKTIRASTLATLLIVLMLFSSFPVMTATLTPEENPVQLKNEGTIAPLSNGDMTFTSGDTIDFTTTETMTFSTGNIIDIWSGIAMNFTSTTKMQFTEVAPDGVLVQCDWVIVIGPVGYLPEECSWWEVLDASGKPIGEFHADGNNGVDTFHIDQVWPGPIVIPIGGIITAVRKIDIIEPCRYFEVHWPSHWWPQPCTWWELIDPETGEFTGVEFHVDWTNESCEFHIDEVLIDGASGIYILPFPWYMLKARQKIPSVEPCDFLVVEHPIEWWPAPCTWWEILDFETGERTGYEFHVDWTNESCEFHVGSVLPPTDPYVFPWPGVPYFLAEEKVVNITICDWYWIDDPQAFEPEPCSWWEILDPSGEPSGIEFHVDDVSGGFFHIDDVLPSGGPLPWGPSPTVTVRRKVEWIEPCSWFIVDDPTTVPAPCTWWKIIYPDIDDVEFHVDDPAGDWFHIDTVLPTLTRIPPTYMVTAERKIDDIQPCDWFKVIDPIAFLPQPCSWWVITYPPEWAGAVFHVDVNDLVDMFHIDEITGLGQPPTIPPWNVTATPYEEPPPPWYKKPPYPDYAPSGVPDFDQKQNGWLNPMVGWTWCGPVSASNSLWWLDSEFEPNVIPPPAIIDNFPLVVAYGPWDDHDVRNLDPLVQNLGWLMDTDGIRSGIPHSGTYWWDFELGVEQYLIQQGMESQFEVHSMEFPDFYWIADEIYACQDVVLLLQFWDEQGEQWIYDPGGEGGHYVTCAGTNITTEELLVSDPWTDNAEAGGPGDVPVAHPYPHGVDIHNDTQYVSHDAYLAAFNPFFGLWELVGFLQGPGYGFPITWHALIFAAIATSPVPGEHDVAILDVTTTKTGCSPAETIGKGQTSDINVTVDNQGAFIETFNVTVYADALTIGSQQVTLNVAETRVLTYTWDTTTYPYGNYSITAVADIVPGEVDVADNTYNYGYMVVTIAGDMDGDGDVDIFDIVIIASAYGTRRGDPAYNPNADIDDDGDVDIFDVVIAAGNYGLSIP